MRRWRLDVELERLRDLDTGHTFPALYVGCPHCNGAGTIATPLELELLEAAQAFAAELGDDYGEGALATYKRCAECEGVGALWVPDRQRATPLEVQQLDDAIEQRARELLREALGR